MQCYQFVVSFVPMIPIALHLFGLYNLKQQKEKEKEKEKENLKAKTKRQKLKDPYAH